jgi:hypothetical protein
MHFPLPRPHEIKNSRYMHTCLLIAQTNSTNAVHLFSPLSPRRLKQLDMLLGMRLLDIRLGHLLHHKVGIDIDFLNQGAAHDAPFARDGQHADRGFGVDERVDARGDVGESELVGGLIKKGG